MDQRPLLELKQHEIERHTQTMGQGTSMTSNSPPSMVKDKKQPRKMCFLIITQLEMHIITSIKVINTFMERELTTQRMTKYEKELHILSK